jgi:triacylglycerol lipase
MKKYLYKKVIIVLLSVLICSHAEAASEGTECVVLLHGLARTEKSMLKLEKHLEEHGFYVSNIGYPSRKEDIQTLSVEAIEKARAECASVGACKIHFVTHSMGGILVRYYLEHNEMQELGRVVMLSPPNSGTEIVDKLKESPISTWIDVPAVQQLGTEEDSLPKALGAPDYEVGIITGDKSINPFTSLLIPGEDDGTVSVENARLMGMKDFLIVHKTHHFIINDESVFRQVTYFLEHGVFDKESQPNKPLKEDPSSRGTVTNLKRRVTNE